MDRNVTLTLEERGTIAAAVHVLESLLSTEPAEDASEIKSALAMLRCIPAIRQKIGMIPAGDPR